MNAMQVLAKYPPLDPTLGTLKDSIAYSVMQFNWTHISREAKRFGVVISTKTKERLINGGDIDLVKSLIEMLMDFERNRGMIGYMRPLINDEDDGPLEGFQHQTSALPPRPSGGKPPQTT